MDWLCIYYLLYPYQISFLFHWIWQWPTKRSMFVFESWKQIWIWIILISNLFAPISLSILFYFLKIWHGSVVSRRYWASRALKQFVGILDHLCDVRKIHMMPILCLPHNLLTNTNQLVATVHWMLQLTNRSRILHFADCVIYFCVVLCI